MSKPREKATYLHKIFHSKLSFEIFLKIPLELFFLLKDTFHAVGEDEDLFC